ncbi:hypothetical protein DBY68_016925 [Pseudocitrobacter sp. RIT415]|uniref:hypothetical protein n=1 Tax=Pseudocitrobacter sp. RIT415 TaxID=2202163 RepID=UPI000D38B61F|nr:hypothetical protein [Pseudocitrobacter sp. RIT 415]RAU45298.1 hypothetical protein DBY68_016925 [Pseudocitrobacter sp. RIT 415]
MAQIILNRANFIHEMTAGKFDQYVISVNGKEHCIIARCVDGTELILGTIGSKPRIWSNIVPPVEFLKEFGVPSFTVEYSKASS